MNEWVASILAGVTLAFGLNALTTLTIRSDQHKGLVWGSFAMNAVLLTPIFLWAGLPSSISLSIASIGVTLGLLCLGVLKIIRHFESKSRRSA